MSPWEIDSFTAGGVDGNGKHDHIGWLKRHEPNSLHIMIQIGYQASEQEARDLLNHIGKTFGAQPIS